MDCKKALEEAQGDFEQAIDLLRKKGHKMAAARQDRDAKEGAVFAAVDGTEGHILLLACETDFVAKNEEFRAFGQKVVQAALQNHITSENELSTLSVEGMPLADKLAELTAKIGEKMEVSRWARLTGEYVTAYIHLGGSDRGVSGALGHGGFIAGAASRGRAKCRHANCRSAPCKRRPQ